mmetsp:Transcript_19187/g.57037  ORF Transcript_19187/g.57037 Transcript_19187/m.57037 type:complete len:221 (-) Transcript_19187:144-806(-)
MRREAGAKHLTPSRLSRTTPRRRELLPSSSSPNALRESYTPFATPLTTLRHDSLVTTIGTRNVSTRSKRRGFGTGQQMPLPTFFLARSTSTASFTSTGSSGGCRTPPSGSRRCMRGTSRCATTRRMWSRQLHSLQRLISSGRRFSASWKCRRAASELAGFRNTCTCTLTSRLITSSVRRRTSSSLLGIALTTPRSGCFLARPRSRCAMARDKNGLQAVLR